MPEQAISRVLFPLREARDNDHSSSPCVATGIERPTRELGRTTLDAPLFGLAPGGVYLAPSVTGGTGELLPHRFTLAPAGDRRGGLFSVALSFLLPGLGVTQHPVLWSPDFPPPCFNQGSGHLSYSDMLCLIIA
jgi:hypothetical protein